MFLVKIVSRFILLSFLFGAALVSAESESDLEFEKQLAEHFLKYNFSPTSEAEWRRSLKATRAKIYKIQKGDNLWELSETLFGDPFFWPKVWSLNASEIFNPHEIEPKMVIQFIPGGMTEPPQINMGMARATELVQMDTYVENIGIDLPPPTRSSNPLVFLPQSIPDWRFGQSHNKTEKFELIPMMLKAEVPNGVINYFGSSSILLGDGAIVATENNSRSASVGDLVYVELEDPKAAKIYSIIQTQGTIIDPYEKRRAYLNHVQGELEVLERVNERRNIYRARVTASFSIIDVGSKVFLGASPRFRAEILSKGPHVNGQIIGGSFSAKRFFFPVNSIVIINAGEDDGVKPGQSFDIFRSEGLENPETPVTSNPKKIGELVVLKTDDSVSTAFIVKAIDSVSVGDALSRESVQYLK